jgi:hypothetical protein
MTQFLTRGIPEVPLGVEPQLRRFLTDVREVLLDLRKSQQQPATPTNFKVTPQAFGNLLQWTPVAGADYHVILWNTKPSLVDAIVAVGIVAGSQYFDYVGQAGVTRWYWLRAHKFVSNLRSLETSAQSGTTLAAGTAVAPPTPPPQSSAIVQNQRTGGREPLRQIR